MIFIKLVLGLGIIILRFHYWYLALLFILFGNHILKPIPKKNIVIQYIGNIKFVKNLIIINNNIDTYICIKFLLYAYKIIIWLLIRYNKTKQITPRKKYERPIIKNIRNINGKLNDNDIISDTE